MSTHHNTAGTPVRPGAPAAIPALAVLVAAVMCVLVAALAWPAVRGGPHDVPIGLAGPAAVTGPVRAQLAGGQPGAFDVHTYPDRAALTTAIRHRDVYGGLAFDASGAHLLTASAASPVLAQALTGLADRVGAATGATVDVTDVVPLPAADPNGVGLATLAVPLALGGIATAVGMLVAFGDRAGSRGVAVRTAAMAAAALAGAFAVTAIVEYGFGSLTGSYWWNTLTLALGVAAIAFPLTGLHMAAGRPGLVVGVLGVVVFGLAVSGFQSAPELLPAGWGRLGQLFPHGAAGTALRSVAFFDGHGAGWAFFVLACWVVGGLVLMSTAASARARTGARASAEPAG